MRISSGICGPNWDWKPRAGRGSRRAGKTSTRMRSSPNPEPTRPGFRGCSEGRSAMCNQGEMHRSGSAERVGETGRWKAVPPWSIDRRSHTRDDLHTAQREIEARGGRRSDLDHTHGLTYPVMQVEELKDVVRRRAPRDPPVVLADFSAGLGLSIFGTQKM